MRTHRGPVVRSPGNFVKRLLTDETGQDLIEYALLAGSIGLVGIAAWQGITGGIGIAYQGWDTSTQALALPPDPVGP